MAEFKEQKDLEPRARYLLAKLCNLGEITLVENVVTVVFNESVVANLASELLDIYKDGWDDRCTAIY